MNKLFSFLLISLLAIALNAQNVTLTIQPSSGDYGLATNCNSNIVAFDLLIEIDQPEWQLRSYNVWTQYPNPDFSYSSDIPCLSQDAGDTDNNSNGQYRVGGANGFTTIEANTPTVFHTIAYSFTNSAAVNGQSIVVGGDAIMYGLSFSTTITLVNELTNVSVGLVITNANEIILSPSTFPCMFGALPIVDLGVCRTRFVGYAPADNGTELNASVSNGTPPYTYSWSPDEYVTNGQNTQTATVFPVVPTNFSVEVTDVNGITVVNSVFVDVVNVASTGLSSMDNPDIIICRKPKALGGESVEMAVPYNSVASYLKNGSHLGPCSNPCIDNINVATAISSKVLDEETVLQENQLDAYPNPTSGPTILTYQVYTDQRITIDIIDVLGKTVDELFTGNAVANTKHTLKLDLELKSGVYFIRMITETETLKHKLVIKK